MKTVMRLLVLILAAALLLAGCGDAANNTSNNTGSLYPAPAGETEAVVPETGEEVVGEDEFIETPTEAVGDVVVEEEVVETPTAADLEDGAETPTAASEDVEEPGAAIDDGAQVIDSENFHLVSDLLGKTIYTPEGEELGTVADLAFDDLTGFVAYVILEPGEGLDVESDRVAFPWTALGSAEPFEDQPEEDFRSFTFNLDPAVLVESPGVSEADLEERGLVMWNPDLYEYWSENSDAQAVVGFSDVTILTQLSGYEEFNVIQGGTLDTFPVQDVLISLSTGTVAYFIVPAGELPFGGEGLALIPYDYLTYTVLEEGIAGYVFAEDDEVPEHFQYLSEEEFEALR